MSVAIMSSGVEPRRGVRREESEEWRRRDEPGHTLHHHAHTQEFQPQTAAAR